MTSDRTDQPDACPAPTDLADTVEDPLSRLRALCLALPQTSERLSHGEPTWFVAEKRTFVTYSNHHHGDQHLSFWCACTPEAQRARIATDPEVYYSPPYVGHRGWLGVRVDVPVDWGEIADLVEEAYRLVAPKRALAELATALAARERDSGAPTGRG